MLQFDFDDIHETQRKRDHEETVRMVLDLKFSEVEENIIGFSTALQEDVSSALKTEIAGIRILDIEAGSVIVTLGLLPPADGRSALVCLPS